MFPQKQSSTATHPLWMDGFVYIQVLLPPPPGSFPPFVCKPPCTRPPTCSVEAPLSQPHTSIETSTPLTEAREWHVWMPLCACTDVCARAAECRGGASCISVSLVCAHWRRKSLLFPGKVLQTLRPPYVHRAAVCVKFKGPSPNTAVNIVNYASELQNKAEDPQFETKASYLLYYFCSVKSLLPLLTPWTNPHTILLERSSIYIIINRNSRTKATVT